MSRPLHTAKEVGQSASGCCRSFAAAARRTGLLGWFPLLAILLLLGLIHGRSPAEEALLPWSVERVDVVVTPGADSVRCVARFDVRAVGEQRAAIPLLAGSFTVESVSASRGARAAAHSDRLLCILEKPGEAAVTVTFQVPIERTDGSLRFTVPLAETLQTQLQLHLPDRNYMVVAKPNSIVSRPEDAAKGYVIRPLSPGPVALAVQPLGVAPEELSYREYHSYNASPTDYGPRGRSRLSVWLVFEGPRTSTALVVQLPKGLTLRKVSSRKPLTYVLSDAGRRLSLVLAPGSDGLQSVSLEVDLPLDPDDPVISLHSLRVQGVPRREGSLDLVVDKELSVEQLEADGLERRARGSALNYRFGPGGYQARFRIAPKPPFLRGSLQLEATLGRGELQCKERVDFSCSGPPAREFRLRVPEGVHPRPLRLHKGTVWWIKEGILFIRPAHFPGRDAVVFLEYRLPVADLSRVVVPVIEPVADELAGQVWIDFEKGITGQVLQSHSLAHERSRPSELGGPQGRLVYRVVGPNISLVLEAHRQTPVVEVQALTSMSFEGERVLLRATVLSNIKRAPLRQLHLHLPDGFAVTEVKGSRLEGWDLVGDGTVLRLDLGERHLGEVRLQVSAERLGDAQAEGVEVAPLVLREATRARGYLAVVPNRDLMVTAEEVTGLLATAPDRVPKELGTVPEQALCYSVTDGAWARLRIAPVQPLARARSATILHFTQGLLSVGCHVTLTVTRGGVEVVDAVIPAGSADVVVSGSAVKGYERVGEDTWRIRFVGKVYDRTEFDIDFKSIISQAQQLVTYPGVVLVEVAQTGVVTVATDPDFEVEEREVTGLAGTMEKGGPGYGEMVDGRALYGYSFERVPFTLSLLTTRLAQAETVQARATAAQLTTVVAGRRTAVSRMLYFVENPGRKQYVTVYLGERSLWSTTANGIPVKPARAEDGRVLIPIAEESQQTGTVQVELIFAEPIPPLGGAAATLALRAPKLDIPVEDLRWDVYTPEGYFLFTSTGELLPYDTPEVAGLGALARSFFHVLGGALSTVLSWLPGALGDVLEGALEFVRDYWWLFVLGAIVGIYLILRYVFHVVIRVSLVGIVVLIGMVSLLVAMLMPALSSGRGEARKAVSRSNLKQIGLALAIYANDNDGWYPGSLDDLYPNYVSDRQLFTNPDMPDERGYFYVPSQRATDDRQQAIAFEDRDADADGMNVLFADGHVEWRIVPKRRAKGERITSFEARPGEAKAFVAGGAGGVQPEEDLKEFEAEEKQQRAQQVIAGRRMRAAGLDEVSRIDTAGLVSAITVTTAKSVRGRAEGAMPMLLALPTGGERYRLYQPFAEREPGGFALALVVRGPFQWVQVLLFFALAGGLAVLARRRPGTVLAVTGAAAAALLLVVLSTSGGLWLLSEAALTGTVAALVFAAVIYQRRRTLQQKSL